MTDDPRRQHAAARAAADEKVFLVDPAALQGLVHAGHQVVVVLARVGVLDALDEALAVARRAAGIQVEERVTGSPVS